MKKESLSKVAPEIAALISKAREAQGMTQKEVSLALGYSSAQFVSNWERAQSLPPKDKLRKLADVLKINFSRLKALYVEQMASEIS